MCAVLTAVTAVAGAILTGRPAVHPLAILAGVTVPAVLMARSLAGRAGRAGRQGQAEVRSLVRLTALIWVSGPLAMLLLR